MAVLRDRILQNSKSSFGDREHRHTHDIAIGGENRKEKQTLDII